MGEKIRKTKEWMITPSLKPFQFFVAIGGIPQSDLAKKIGVELNPKGEIIIDRSSKTNIEGVFAAGDVVDTEFKQAITGVGEGVHAAYQAYTYVNSTEFVIKCELED